MSLGAEFPRESLFSSLDNATKYPGYTNIANSAYFQVCVCCNQYDIRVSAVGFTWQYLVAGVKYYST